MTDVIFEEEPLQFYSHQMKKNYCPPEFKMALIKKIDETKKNRRNTIQIGNATITIPAKKEVVKKT